MEEIHAACQDAANGLPSRRPIIEMTIPSILDRTISPPGTLSLRHFCYLIPCNIFIYVVELMGSVHYKVFYIKGTESAVKLQFSVHSHVGHEKDILPTDIYLLTLPAITDTHTQIFLFSLPLINLQNASLIFFI